MILQTFLVRVLSPFCKSKWYANPPRVGKRAWSGGGSGAVRVLHVRHMSLFERKVSHCARKRTDGKPRAAWERERVRTPPEGHMHWAVGEAVSLATPAPCMSMKGQTLCHYAPVDNTLGCYRE